MNLVPSHVTVGLFRTGDFAALVPAPAVTVRNLGEILSELQRIEQRSIERVRRMCEAHTSGAKHHPSVMRDVQDVATETYWEVQKLLQRHNVSALRVWQELEQRTSRRYVLTCWWNSIFAEAVRQDRHAIECTPIGSIH